VAPTKIAIVGAGLGGLAAALFLRRAGLDVAVYEQSTAFQEIGAGIVVPPNMVRPLRRLGLAKTLDEFAVRLEFAWEFRRWQDGRVISTTPMGERCELMYGAPCYVAHRADLREFLRSALPEETVRLDHRCSGVTQSRKGVVLEFVSASGRMLHVEADAAIGADGIHSNIRDSVTTQEEPRFSGLCAFRCLVPADRAPEMARRPVHTLWLGPGRHFVHYPISAGRLINIVAIAPAGDWRSESWTADGRFRTWRASSDSGTGGCISLSCRPRRPNVGPSSIERRWSNGRPDAFRCLETRRMRCCRFLRKARRSAWRTL